eukprot:256777-Amphidinium_carterae.2
MEQVTSRGSEQGRCKGSLHSRCGGRCYQQFVSADLRLKHVKSQTREVYAVLAIGLTLHGEYRIYKTGLHCHGCALVELVW